MNHTEFRAALKAHGLKQNQLATRLGIDLGTVNRWATGKLPVPQYAVAYFAALSESEAAVVARIKAREAAEERAITRRIQARMAAAFAPKRKRSDDGSNPPPRRGRGQVPADRASTPKLRDPA